MKRTTKRKGAVETKRRNTEIREAIAEADSNLIERFMLYHHDNPHVYEEFVQRAFTMRRAGRQQYSQWVIIQAMRWDYDLEAEGDVFKINNDFIALYARLAIHDHPSLRGFFELRAMKPDDRRMSTEERYRRGDHG